MISEHGIIGKCLYTTIRLSQHEDNIHYVVYDFDSRTNDWALLFDYQQQASAQMGMGMMMNPNMMNKTGMMGMGMGNMMMNPNMMGMMNPNMMGMGNMMMFNGSLMNPMMMPGQNITGSIKLKPAIFNSIASQIKISLSDAAASAQNELGNNSRVVAGHLDIVNGYLIYTICAIDPDMNIHRLIVDAGNGNVLSSSSCHGRIK